MARAGLLWPYRPPRPLRSCSQVARSGDRPQQRIRLGPASYGRTGPRARRSHIGRWLGRETGHSKGFGSGRSPDRARCAHVARWLGRETGHSNGFGSGRFPDRARRSYAGRWRGRETGHSNNEETGRARLGESHSQAEL